VSATPAPGPTALGVRATLQELTKINLPPPQHTCRAVVAKADLYEKKITPYSIGDLYTAALLLTGVTDAKEMTLGQMIQAYSDMMGCFVAVPVHGVK
jgi:hypothetical protein